LQQPKPTHSLQRLKISDFMHTFPDKTQQQQEISKATPDYSIQARRLFLFMFF
jgi:hypothetical protein